MRRKFFHRRIAVTGATIPETIRRVWMGELATPPLRWRKGQKGSSVHVPGTRYGICLHDINTLRDTSEETGAKLA